MKYPTPQNGFDRTAGRGIGHLFVMEVAGNLQKDITLREGDMYHPGGIDFDGTNFWVPVAQSGPTAAPSSTPAARLTPTSRVVWRGST